MDNIDKIFYINLDRRTDRRIEFEAEIEKLPDKLPDNYKSKLERFPAISHSNGAIGCSMSHLEVVKKARENGYQNIIIFEDDFHFIVSGDVFLNNLEKLFTEVEKGFKFNVVMLSYNALEYQDYNEFLYSSTNVQTASGYIINQSCYDALIECWEQAIPLFIQTGQHWKYINDQSWKTLQRELGGWYLFKERIGKQRPGYSDLGNCYCDNQC